MSGASPAAAPPFGACAPGAVALALRAAAMAAGPGKPGRMLRSLVARLTGGRSGQPVDLVVFGDQRARLRPVGNLSEKRVHAGDRWWEARERAFIAQRLRAHSGAQPFVFFDVGANAGLYTLAARAEARAAGRTLRAVLIEPQPEMLARLRFNLAASGATGAEALTLPWAVTAARGTVSLGGAHGNLGAVGVTGEGPGALSVEGRPLIDALGAADVSAIDLMKIDIEGHETAALTPFFDAAPRAAWPRAVIIESRDAGPSDGLSLCLARGYRLSDRSRMNAMLSLD